MDQRPSPLPAKSLERHPRRHPPTHIDRVEHAPPPTYTHIFIHTRLTTPPPAAAVQPSQLGRLFCRHLPDRGPGAANGPYHGVHRLPHVHDQVRVWGLARSEDSSECQVAVAWDLRFVGALPLEIRVCWGAAIGSSGLLARCCWRLGFGVTLPGVTKP
eukprot:349679-Chlamydomonas_euryale.AAC.8